MREQKVKRRRGAPKGPRQYSRITRARRCELADVMKPETAQERKWKKEYFDQPFQ
jgi:hypothetical protein